MTGSGKKKIDSELKHFNSKNPDLEDFDLKLKEFQKYEDEVDSILINHQIGALNLRTENVKHGLKKWIDHWKEAFSKDLHKKAKNMLEQLQDEIKQISLKVKKPAENIDSLGSIMFALEEIR